jgi:citrate lyase gamma subunit
VIPVSYDRVTGHDVSITLSAGFTPEQIAPTAKEMKASLNVGSVEVQAEVDAGAPRFIFHATVPGRSRAEAARAAGAFVKVLAQKGYGASLAVAPHKERVTSPAVAYAWNQIIQISVDGKSASALESEIRQRLAESGMPDAQVSVKDSPQGGREISVNMQRQNFGGTPAGQEPPPELVLTKNGAPITGGSTVKIRKMKDQTGATSLVVETSDKGRTATATIPNSDKMSDAELGNAIEAQLRQAGLNVRVGVVGGQIKVRPIE